MSTTTHHSVAANIRAEASRRRVRQAQLADVLGISQQAMSRRLNGDVAIDVDELHLLAAFLDVPASSLLDGVEPTQATA